MRYVQKRQREHLGDPAWSENLACTHAPWTATGRSPDRPQSLLGGRSAVGRRGAVATDARFGEVRLCHSSCEATEQSWAAGCGGGGAKGRGQGKRGPAKHAPDPEPEARDPGAEPRTASCKAQEERAVHRASPPSQRRHTPDGVPRAQAQGRSWRGRGDMAGLRGGPRAQSRGPPQRDPRGSVSAATVSPDVHTEGGWSAKAAGGRSTGGQDRPGRMRHGAQRYLRRGFPRVLIWVPTRTRAARCAGCFVGGDHQSEGELHT